MELNYSYMYMLLQKATNVCTTLTFGLTACAKQSTTGKVINDKSVIINKTNKTIFIKYIKKILLLGVNRRLESMNKDHML